MKKLDIDREYCLLKINQDDIFSLLNLEKKLLTNHKKCINQNKYKKSICGKEKDKDKKILDEINKRLHKIESNIDIIEESLYNELDKLKPIKEVNENITDDEEVEEEEEIIENEKKIARDKLQKESNIIPISFSDLSSSSCSSSSSISTNSEKLKTRKKIKNKSYENLKKTRKIKHYKNVKKNIKKPPKYDINITTIWNYIKPKSRKLILELVKKIR